MEGLCAIVYDDDHGYRFAYLLTSNRVSNDGDDDGIVGIVIELLFEESRDATRLDVDRHSCHFGSERAIPSATQNTLACLLASGASRIGCHLVSVTVLRRGMDGMTMRFPLDMPLHVDTAASSGEANTVQNDSATG